MMFFNPWRYWLEAQRARLEVLKPAAPELPVVTLPPIYIKPPKSYTELLKENAQRSKVKHVRFFCYVPDKETGKTNRQGAFFSVGLGPCGRFVDNLDVRWTDHLLTIRQRSQDAEFNGEAETKVFLYPLKDIEGRIEILE